MLACISMTSPINDEMLMRAAETLLSQGDTSAPCSLQRRIDGLRPDVQDVIIRLLASTKSTREIHSVLKRAGFKISRDTIDDHRQQRCTCGAAG